MTSINCRDFGERSGCKKAYDAYKGEWCTTNEDCCSGKCRERSIGGWQGQWSLKNCVIRDY